MCEGECGFRSTKAMKRYIRIQLILSFYGWGKHIRKISAKVGRLHTVEARIISTMRRKHIHNMYRQVTSLHR